ASLCAVSTGDIVLGCSGVVYPLSTLISKVCEVYKFLIEADVFNKWLSATSTLTKISDQLSECVRFICQYDIICAYWTRIEEDVLWTTHDKITEFTEVLDGLMRALRDDTTDDDIDTVRFMEDIVCEDEEIQLVGIAYAPGVGVNTTKRCLEGTREDILAEIVSWITSTDTDTPRIFWLSGQAGQGKSAIAHTVALWFSNLGGLGTMFCFSRRREADLLHEKVFLTIARDLADRDPSLKRALAEVISEDPTLKSSTDISRHWEKLVVEPVSRLGVSLLGRLVIVIDALDESGMESTREQILHVLKTSQIPTNFRILVTSRLLGDVDDAVRSLQHIKRKSIDDIPPASIEKDIRAYISDQLQNLGDVLHDEEISQLVGLSRGVFERARFACQFVKSSKGGSSAKERLEDLVSRMD
ncbi:hypothetical protein ID866_9951, partial [Astraeus odoratus]